MYTDDQILDQLDCCSLYGASFLLFPSSAIILDTGGLVVLILFSVPRGCNVIAIIVSKPCPCEAKSQDTAVTAQVSAVKTPSDLGAALR